MKRSPRRGQRFTRVLGDRIGDGNLIRKNLANFYIGVWLNDSFGSFLRKCLDGSQKIANRFAICESVEQKWSGSSHLLFVRIDLAFALNGVDLIQFFQDLSKDKTWSY